MAMPSATVEDYIKQIYLVSERSGREEVPMGQVAEALGVVPGTATTMVKTLAEAELLDYAPRVGVSLTRQGRTLALHVLRRHRLIEQFLVEVLDFDWSEVHEEAERMEHVVSDLLLERIDKYLGHPTEDPHGDPIPSAKGVLQQGSYASLVDCEIGSLLTVARISDQDTEFLQYIAGAGLSPGATVRVVKRHLSGESVQLEVGRDQMTLSLGLGAAEKILVKV